MQQRCLGSERADQSRTLADSRTDRARPRPGGRRCRRHPACGRRHPAVGDRADTVQGATGTDTLVLEARSTAVRTALTDQGRAALRNAHVTVTAPDGWVVTPKDATSALRLRTGRAPAPNWTLTVPTGIPPAGSVA